MLPSTITVVGTVNRWFQPTLAGFGACLHGHTMMNPTVMSKFVTSMQRPNCLKLTICAGGPAAPAPTAASGANVRVLSEPPHAASSTNAPGVLAALAWKQRLPSDVPLDAVDWKLELSLM